MASRRIIKYGVQAIIGVFDDDGNLIDEEPQPVESLFHPFGLSLENLTARLEKQHNSERQGVKRS